MLNEPDDLTVRRCRYCDATWVPLDSGRECPECPADEIDLSTRTRRVEFAWAVRDATDEGDVIMRPAERAAYVQALDGNPSMSDEAIGHLRALSRFLEDM
jgi:hypothetical protein